MNTPSHGENSIFWEWGWGGGGGGGGAACPVFNDDYLLIGNQQLMLISISAPYPYSQQSMTDSGAVMKQLENDDKWVR